VAVHQWQSRVRDYEGDIYGGVNAATYMNFMEEARKWFLAQYGFNLKAMFERDLGFVGTRYEIDYKLSLYPGDEFVIETSMVRTSRLLVKFTQHVFRLPDRKLALECTNYGLPITVSTGKPTWPIELEDLLMDFPIQPKTQT